MAFFPLPHLGERGLQNLAVVCRVGESGSVAHRKRRLHEHGGQDRTLAHPTLEQHPGSCLFVALEAGVDISRAPALRRIAGDVLEVTLLTAFGAAFRQRGGREGEPAFAAFPIGQTTFGADVALEAARCRVSTQCTRRAPYRRIHFLNLPICTRSLPGSPAPRLNPVDLKLIVHAWRVPWAKRSLPMRDFSTTGKLRLARATR